jgi:energy-coupling factor transporter ATP-binding protein EcfA2
MLTKIKIRNFKKFDEVEIELGNPVVFIGPNNSGKTTALQALALWHTGLKKWMEKCRGKPAAEKRPGVTINRRDLIAIPVPDANLLWRDLHVRNVQRPNQTTNVRLGEGRTAEVLRNLCYQISTEDDIYSDSANQSSWKELTTQVNLLFGVSLDQPKYIQERGEIALMEAT